MKLIVMLGFLIIASLLLEVHSFRIKAHFPPKSARRLSRLVLSGAIPSLREVTVCHRVNCHSSDRKFMFVVSYATGNSSNELLTGIEFGPKDGSPFDYMTPVLWVRNTTSKMVRVSTNDVEEEVVRFFGRWHHLCFTWSSGDGQSEFYLDGKLSSTSSNPHSTLEIRGGGILIIGQDQDAYNGGFDPDQAWDGFVSDVQIWDEKLNKEQIAELSQCGKLEGNVFAWMRSPVVAEDGVTLSRTSSCSD